MLLPKKDLLEKPNHKIGPNNTFSNLLQLQNVQNKASKSNEIKVKTNLPRTFSPFVLNHISKKETLNAL